MKDLIKENSYLKGVACILLASILWAFGYFIRKMILIDFSPVLLSFINSILASIMLYFQYEIKISEAWQTFKKRPWIYLFLSVTGVIFGTTFMYIALKQLDLGLTTLLEKLQPIFTVMLAYIFLQEKFTLLKGLYAIIAIFAAYIITAYRHQQIDISNLNILGLSSVIFAAFAWAIAAILAKKALIQGDKPEIISFLRFFIASILYLPIILISNNKLNVLISVKICFWIVISTYVSTVIGYILFYRGLKIIPASLSSILELMTTITAVSLGIIFFHEKLNFIQIIYCQYFSFNSNYMSI